MSQSKRKAKRHSSGRNRAVRALETKLDGVQDQAVLSIAPAEAVSTTAAPAEAAGPGDELPAPRPEELAPSPALASPSDVVEVTGLPVEERASSESPRYRLRDLFVVAPDRGCPTQLLRARVPFEMQLAFDLPGDPSSPGAAVLCEVSVQARRVGSSETSILGHATQDVASGTRTVSLRWMGLPLNEGLFRLEATATVRGPGDGQGTASFDGGLIRVV